MGEGRGEEGGVTGEGGIWFPSRPHFLVPHTSARISVALGDAAAPCPSAEADAAAICFLSCASTDMAACASLPHSPARLIAETAG